MRKRGFYDTSIILLVILNKEHLLPKELLQSIPTSTKNTWKHYSTDKFISHRQLQLFQDGIRNTEIYQKYQHLKKVQRCIEIIYISVADMLDHLKLPLYQVNQYKTLVIDLIQKYHPLIGLKKLLYCFRISKSTYHNWLLLVKVKCSGSYFELCVRRYGTQLLKWQVQTIKSMLENPAYFHWSVPSLSKYCQRENIVQAGRTTWYRLRKIFDINRRKFKKTIKRKGIVSTRPNEYWHIDVTYFTSLDGIKHCIYFLIDNYSKKVLAYRLTQKLSWKYVKECIHEAYALAKDHPLTLEIISDGGPENTHHELVDYISRLPGPINKSIALKDILYSNNPVEATHKTFKTYYASEGNTENEKQLRSKLEFFVYDYNAVRPAESLKGFTPDEVYFNNKPDFDFSGLLQDDAILRKQAHRNTACKGCDGLKRLS